MYPFEPVRPAWETLWTAVHRSAPWTPATLRWSDDVHDTWTDANCVVAQACGWPVAALLRGKLGFENENLIGFGVPPRKRARKKPELKVTPPPAPAGSPEPAG